MKLEYKYRETYNSIFGGILTLLMKGLTMAMVVQAVLELVLMENPLITNFTKPVNSGDISYLIPFKFSENDNYILAFKVFGDIIPPEVGAVKAIIIDLDTEEKSPIELKSCNEVLSKETILKSIDNDADFATFDYKIFCLNPEDA